MYVTINTLLRRILMSNKHRRETSVKTARLARDPAKLFVCAVALSAAIYFVIYLFVGDGRFTDMFFIRCADFFMDFFNSIRDAAQGSGVYTERGVIYPPMANLIYLILSRFTPNSYNDTSFTERYEWVEYISPMMLVLIYTAAFALIFFFLVYTGLQNGSRLKKAAFAFFAFFSVPMLYMTERGNMVMFCMISLLIYAMTYHSESKAYREIGLVALAFAFSLKLYPVVFGWLLIADKRWKDALRCAIYGLLMLVLPSFFFGGPKCLVWVIGNIFDFSSGNGSILSTMLRYIGTPAAFHTVATIVVYLWVLVCGACFAISPFVGETKYKTWILGFATILCIPSLTSLYIWAFLIIPLIALCNKKELNKSERAYAVILTLPFIFIPFRISYHITISTILIYVATAALSVFAVIETLKAAKAFISQKKSEGVKLKDYLCSLFK